MLINYLSLLPRAFVEKKGDRETTGIYIDNQKTAATDRYTLLEVEHPTEATAEEFPQVPGQKIMPEVKPHIMPVKAAEKLAQALKGADHPIKVLNHAAALKVRAKGAAGFVSTDLETATPVIYHKKDGDFPKYAEIIPGSNPKEKPAASVVVDPAYLKRMAATFEAAGINQVRLEIYHTPGEYEKPVKFTGKAHTGQKITGLIMPIRDTESGS